MKNRMLTGLITSVLLAGVCGPAYSSTITTLVDQGSEWNYHQFSSPDLWADWANAGHSSFNWAGATWSTGNAAFGNAGPFTTSWAANTDLALQKTFNVGGTLSSPLTLNVAADNGFIVFINGVEVAKQNAEGFTSYWEYTLSLDSSLGNFISPGSNLIQVLAEDHGGATFFDMKLTGSVSTVPEPNTIVLLGAGLMGLIGFGYGRMPKARANFMATSSATSN